MAFTLVNGEWVTRRLDVNSVLRHHNQQDRDAATSFLPIEEPPKLGILTQTVIRSPLVHWILPIRLRDDQHHDVAFIGDDFVQIKELRSDGLLWDVIRKDDFGARIRNACVVGSLKAYEEDPDVTALSGNVKVEDGSEDSQMNGSSSDKTAENSTGSKRILPPQFLLLQLDTGDSGFLMVSQTEDDEGDTKLEFVSSRYRVSKPMLKLQPGTHLAVDPSSRYMAVGCSEGVFAIYALQSRDTLKKQYLEGSPLRHVESETQLYFNGVIVKMEFLHPSAGDNEEIILLVLMVIKGKTRMLLYEWIAGSDIKKIAPRSSKGYLLERSRRMPLLLIPLTFKSSFILVYEDSLAVCQDIMIGTPRFEDYPFRNENEPTTFHQGLGKPLWTAWTRPSRLESHTATRDDLYIAREDGRIKFLEIDSEDPSIVSSDNNFGEFEANCGTALATMDYPNRNRKGGDLFIMGGNSCPGGTYLVQARNVPMLTEPLPNWSPAHDFVTTYNLKADAKLNDSGLKSDMIPKPDRIFACVGKGLKGGITEFRHGREANIGLEVDYDVTITHAWALSPKSGMTDDGPSYIFLLSVGDRSGVLRMSADAEEISELDESETCLDLNHRTILAVTSGDLIIQVTEESVVITNGAVHCVYGAEEILEVRRNDVLLGRGSTISHATVWEECVLLVTKLESADDCNYLQILDVRSSTSNMEVDSTSARTLCQLSDGITCITACRIGGIAYAIVTCWTDEGSTVLAFHPISGGSHKEVLLPLDSDNDPGLLDAVTSMSVLPIKDDKNLLMCGTRNGFVIALELDGTPFKIVATQFKQIGATPVNVSIDEFSKMSSLFATCDSKCYVVTPKIKQESQCHLHALDVSRVWLSDALKPGLQQPLVTSIARMLPLPGGTNGSLLVISGSQLLITGLSTQSKPVTRHMVIGGTPNRLLYSKTLNLLVVAASINERSSILFIDPETGEDISEALDERTKQPVESISGLGNPMERIFRLFEWSFTKDSKTWNFIIASTSTGRLLIISIHEAKGSHSDPRMNGSSAKRKINFYTRHKFKYNEPVYSAAGLSDGLIWGAGLKLFYDILDLTQKKFRRVAEYDLPSPAIDLSYQNGMIYVLTSCHSLETFQLVPDRPGEFRIVRTHGDQLARDSLHHLAVDGVSDRPLHLVSDKLSSVVGLWPTYNTKADTLEPIFEAALPFSILRFRFARCRPVWDPVWAQRQLTGVDVTSIMSQNLMGGHEALGLSISGSLSNFTILDFKTWKFMRLIVDLCIRSSKICEFTYKDDPMPFDTPSEPKVMMHIDGDVLRRCIEDRRMEELLPNDTEEAISTFKTFTALLQDVHGGSLEKDAPAEVYLNQAYKDLEYYLRPVL